LATWAAFPTSVWMRMYACTATHPAPSFSGSYRRDLDVTITTLAQPAAQPKAAGETPHDRAGDGRRLAVCSGSGSPRSLSRARGSPSSMGSAGRRHGGGGRPWGLLGGGVVEIVVPAKIRAPHQPELAIGAVASDGSAYLDDRCVARLQVSTHYLAAEIEAVKQEIARRTRARGPWCRRSEPLIYRCASLARHAPPSNHPVLVCSVTPITSRTCTSASTSKLRNVIRCRIPVLERSRYG